jgi:hypothetical protein
MFKKSLLALGVLAASANVMATTTVSQSGDVDYATEMFGTTGVLNTAVVTLTVGAAVEAGATANFTYTLSDGVFGADPTLAFNDTNAGSSVGIAKASGGVGSDTVNFTVVVNTDLDAGDNFDLTLVSIQSATTLGTVDNVVTVTPVVDNTNLVANGFVETVTNLDAANTTVATGKTGLELVATQAAPQILVADQTSFSGATADAVDLFSDVDVAGIANVKGLDGATDFDVAAGDTVVLTVSGSVAANSSICLAADGATDCDTPVGTFATTTSGSTITLTGAQVAGLAGTEDIVYEVDGETNIPVGDFSLSAEVTFDNASYNESVSYTFADESSLSLAGLTQLDEASRINIITKPGAADETFVRVTNNANTETQVYITLRTQGGEEAFGALGAIAAGETVVYSSDDISTAVGVETWTGRGNAILSASTGTQDDLVIVPLIRTNGVLTNQSGSVKNP